MKYIFLFLILPCMLLSFTPHPVTPYPVVGVSKITFNDDLLNQQRDITIWYPVGATITGTSPTNHWDIFNIAENAPIRTSSQKKGIIILSHGYNGNPDQLSWLILELVYQDFIVLGIKHLDHIDGQYNLNHWLRARDISLMIDQFTSSAFSRYADLNQIAIAGYSLGGTTAILVSGGKATKLDHMIPTAEYADTTKFSKAKEGLPKLHKEMMSKDWSEPRIKSAFIMAPSWAWLFDEENLHKISIPVYLIAAAADATVITAKNAHFFAKNIPNAIFQEIPGKASHYIFISSLTQAQKARVNPNKELPAELFLDDVSVDRAWIQKQVSEEAVRFLHSTLKIQ